MGLFAATWGAAGGAEDDPVAADFNFPNISIFFTK
jgi:hypothetical protein